MAGLYEEFGIAPTRPAPAMRPPPQPEREPEPERGSFADPVLQGMTFGWGDEGLSYVLASIAQMTGRAPEGESFEETRAQMLNNLRTQEESFRERNPKTAIAGEVAGGLLTGGAGIAKGVQAAVKPTASMLKRGAASAGIGAAEGGLYGAGQAKEGQRAQGATEGAIAGAVAGPLAQYGISKISDAIGNRAMARRLLQDGVIDERTAGLMLRPGMTAEGIERATGGRVRQGPLEGIERATGGRVRQGPLLESVGVQADTTARAAMDQGWTPATVTLATRANPATRAKMQQMAQIRREVAVDPEKRISTRASDVIGESVGDRFDHVLDVNRRAGRAIDQTSQRLKGKMLNAEPVARDFMESLESSGIKLLDANGNVIKAKSNTMPESLDFKGSDFEGLDDGIKIIENVFNRLKGSNQIDAYDVHRMKRFIDNNVSYEPGATGAKREAESMVKNLRANLDGLLDGKFKFYDRANRVYAETIEPINEMRRLIGKKTDITTPEGRKQAGILARRSTSNAQSAGQVRKNATDLDRLAKKYGGKFDDNINQLLAFENELNRVLGTSADTSFQGLVRQGSQQGIEDVIGGKPTALGVAARLRQMAAPTVNEENLYQTLDELLRRSDR